MQWDSDLAWILCFSLTEPTGLGREVDDESLRIHNYIHLGSDAGLDDPGDLLSSERRASRGN